MASSLVKKQDHENARSTSNDHLKQAKYLEILGDTVIPVHLLITILLSIALSLGGYTLGLKIFPLIADEKMISSYSLLLGIVGSLLSIFINARFFKPTRILKEEEESTESMIEIFEDLQLDPEEEYELIVNDPVTKKEMESLGVFDKFKGLGEKSRK